jgi:hypothetical protein
MAVLNLDTNALFGESGTGKLYIATDYDSAVFAQGDGTNEDASITTIEANYTFADVGYFENFAAKIAAGDEKIINTDYCDVGEISRKIERIPGFTVDVQEILDMTNLSLILGLTLNTDVVGVETIGYKRSFGTNPYQLFKFVSCPKSGKSNTFYFVKAALTGDLELPYTNLKTNDFVGVSMEFAVAD